MPDDPFASLSTSPPPKPEFSGLDTSPPPEDTRVPDPVALQLHRGQALDDPLPISERMKTLAAEQFKQGGVSGYAAGTALGMLAVATTPSDMIQNAPKALYESAKDFATFPNDIATGKVQTDEEIIPRAINAASFVIGGDILGHLGEAPLVPTKTGNLARVLPDAEGKPTARVIGPPPTDHDFQAAAQAIDPKLGLVPPAADVKPSPIKPIEGSPVAAETPRSQLAKTGIPEVDTVVSQLRNVIDNPVVDRTRDIPNSWGGSTPLNNPTTYIDHRFPTELSVPSVSNPARMVKFDPAEPAILHENTEEAVVDILMKSGMDQPTALSVAYHGWGNPVEHAWYRAHDMDPAAVEKVLRPILDKIATEKSPNIPADLFKGTYPKGDPQLTSTNDIPKPSAADAAKGAQIVKDYYEKNPVRTVADKLKENWQTFGVHPYEAADAAANRPVMARDLSSASSPVLPLPARPSKRYIQEVDDNFHRLATAHTADQSEMLGLLEKLPSEVKTGEMQEKWYRYGEGDPEVHLTPEEGKKYNEVMIPLKKEELQLWEEAKATDLDVSEYDPNYMHRVVKGKTPQIDKLAGEGGNAAANPIYNGTGLLARSTSSMHERKYFALENESGERHVVVMNKGEMSFIHGDQGVIHRSDEPLKIGSQIKLDQTYTIRQALTREIEASTKTRYYKNALVNTMDNVLHLRAVTRAISEIQRMRDTPEWAEYTTPTAKIHGDTSGWITPKMPMFKNDLMDPKLAHVIDDFYGKVPEDGLEASLEKINHYAVGSMFWTPVPHALNAAAWWATERGWDWITPSGMKSVVVDGAKAIRQVVTQGPDYQRMLREGASLMYAGVNNRDFYQKLLKRAGMELPKDPEWEQIAKAVGQSPVDLVKGIYNAATNSLWAFSDIVQMQRLYELQNKGMSAREAIDAAEKIMPNYRVPSEILRSRSIQQVYTNPNLFNFSRYHYGVMKGYANMAMGLAVGTPKQKFDTVGRIMALGVLQMLLWPAESAGLTAAYHAFGGDPNTKIKAPSAGPGKLAEPVIGAVVGSNPSAYPKFIQDYYHHDSDLMRQLANLAPLAPVAKFALETGTNRDFFTGKPIAEPSDVRHGRIGRVMGQEAEHAAGSLVEPYNTVSQAMKQGNSIPQTILEQAFGLQEQSSKKEEARAKAFHWQDKDAARRKPQGLIEGLTK